jgi:hypothetical protein
MRPLAISLIIFHLITSCKKQDIPIVATAEVTAITPSSATINGKILSFGESEIISRGFIFGITSNTLMDTLLVEGNEIGDYFYNLTDLIPEQEYNVKAFATNSFGTGYGNTIFFTTGQASLPTITTLDVYNITCTTVTCGGEISDDGGVKISDRGMCWGISENPTKNDFYVSLETEYKINLFSYTIKNLEINSPYYLRAYATNFAGTDYGQSVRFSTKFPDPDYDPNSIIGTWELYFSSGGFDGGGPILLGTTSIREFTKDSIMIGQFIGGSIFPLYNHKFTISCIS